MVSLVYHRPHCFALDRVVTITADQCSGPREPHADFPRRCIREVRCFYMRAKVRDRHAVLTNPLAQPREDGTWEPVGPAAGDSGRDAGGGS